MRVYSRSPGQVREFAERVAGDLAAEDVAARFRRFAGEGVEVGAGDVWIGVEVGAGCFEHFGKRCDERVVRGISTNRVGLADVCFPSFRRIGFEDGAEIEIDRVVLADGAFFGIVGENAECVGAGTDEAFVPVAGNAEVALGEGGNIGVDFAFAAAGLDEARVLDGSEHSQRALFGGNELGEASGFVGGHGS